MREEKNGETTVFKNNIIRRIALTFGGVLLLVGAYYGGTEYWLWKWESPHDPLPADTLSHYDKKVFSTHYSKLAESFDEETKAAAEKLQTTSISGAVAIGSKPVWAGAVGLANVDTQQPATINSAYRIGSVSKSITAATLMRMVQEDLIDLDTDIKAYLPDYPTYTAPMTARQLASHMAGVRHYSLDLTQFPPTDFYSTDHYDDVEQAIAQFRDDPLLFEPGSGFSYSTHGYTLLSAVMQAAAGKPFLQLVSDHVLTPAGMSLTTPEDPTKPMPNIVEFYTAGNGLYGETAYVDLSNKWAGGGFTSSPTDLVKFGAAILNGGLLSPENHAEMIKVQPMPDGSENPQSYALGWRHHKTINILGEENPVDVIHHGGTAAGAVAFLLLVPNHNITIAFVSNGRGDDTRRELQLLAYRVAKAIITAAGKSETTE